MLLFKVSEKGSDSETSESDESSNKSVTEADESRTQFAHTEPVTGQFEPSVINFTTNEIQNPEVQYIFPISLQPNEFKTEISALSPVQNSE